MKETTVGANRTGIATCPGDGRELVEAAAQVPPSSPGSEADAARVRTEYAGEAGPVGSVPPPGSLKGLMKAAVQLIQGRPPAILIDKLAERLAFERSGTRLYDSLIAKLDATGSFEGGPTRADLQAIRDEELGHVALLRGALERIGADPTAQTPGADVVGLASTGLFGVVLDPRTSLGQSLEALLIAELTDNDSWRMLIELATAYEQHEMAADFRAAELAEQRHLASVRAWLANKLALDARAAPTEGQPAAA
jgi:rubrerythrin